MDCTLIISIGNAYLREAKATTRLTRGTVNWPGNWIRSSQSDRERFAHVERVWLPVCGKRECSRICIYAVAIGFDAIDHFHFIYLVFFWNRFNL